MRILRNVISIKALSWGKKINSPDFISNFATHRLKEFNTSLNKA
jgi:hypothetical protein